MNKNDNAAIVKEFLNLWQKQFAALSMEGDTVGHGLSAFQKMQDAYMSSLGESLGNKNNAKPTATTDLLRDINEKLSMLATSYVSLEGRIARIESLLTERGEGNQKEATKPKSGGIGRGTTKTSG